MAEAESSEEGASDTTYTDMPALVSSSEDGEDDAEDRQDAGTEHFEDTLLQKVFDAWCNLGLRRHRRNDR